MATTIVTKYGSDAPAASDIVRGELAVDTENGRLYTENSSGAVVEIGLNPEGNVDVTGTVTTDGLTSAGDAAITGSSSGSTVLTLTSNALADTPLMVFQRTGGAVAGKLAYEDTNTAMSFGTTTGHELKFLTSNTERMQIDSSGNVGIGTSSPNQLLTVANSSGGATVNISTDQAAGSISSKKYMNLDFSGYLNTVMARIQSWDESTSTGNGYLTFHTTPAGGSVTERMRIDSSGNLLVGKTSAGSDTAGFQVLSTGKIAATVSGDETARFNRTTSDGDIVEFRKDDTTVGSIGTNGGRLSIGSGDVNLNFNASANSIYPISDTAGTLSDGIVDVGASTARFKDLHLSGLGYISGSDTQTNNIASASLGLRLSNTSNTDNNFAPIDFFNSSGFVTARIGAQFVDAGDRNTDLFFATRANSGSLTERMRIDSSGNLLIGVSTFANNTLGVAIRGAASGATDESIRCAVPATSSVLQIGFYNANGRVGSISTSGSATAFNTSSDYRLKENVVAMSGATERLKQLKPSRFNFIADANTTVDGFLAHEVQDVVPEAISGTKDAMRDEEYEVTPAVLDDDGNVVTEAVIGTRSVPDYQGIDQSKLVPLLVATIQELEARIAALES